MARKAILAILVAFAIYSVLANPTGSAEVVKACGNALKDAAEAILTFFKALNG